MELFKLALTDSKVFSKYGCLIKQVVDFFINVKLLKFSKSSIPL